MGGAATIGGEGLIVGHLETAFVIGGVLALVCGLLGFVGLKSSTDALRAENAQLKAAYEEKSNAAAMRDALLQSQGTGHSEANGGIGAIARLRLTAPHRPRVPWTARGRKYGAAKRLSRRDRIRIARTAAHQLTRLVGMDIDKSRR